MLIDEVFYRAPTEEESQIIYEEETKACKQKFIFMIIPFVIMFIALIVFGIKSTKEEKAQLEIQTQKQLQESESSYDSCRQSAIVQLYGRKQDYIKARAGEPNDGKYLDQKATNKQGKIVFSKKRYKKAYNKYLKEYNSKIVEKDVIAEMHKLGWKSKAEINAEAADAAKKIGLKPFVIMFAPYFIGVLIYIIGKRMYYKKKLKAYENKEYMVVPALYYGSESVINYDDVDKLLRFHYGDGYKYTCTASSDSYLRGCNHCLIVKRKDNKKGFIFKLNPDIVRID